MEFQQQWLFVYVINLFGDPEMSVWSTIPLQFAGMNVTSNLNSVSVNAGVGGCGITACSIDNGATYFFTVNGSSATFNTSVRRTITKPNYLPFTAITDEPISSNTRFNGVLKVLGNLTVTNGATLTIESGASDKEIPLLSELDKVYQLIASNNLKEARAICMNLINNYPDYSVSYNALNLLKDTYLSVEITNARNNYKSLFNTKEKKWQVW